MSRFIEIDGKQYRLEPDGELYANTGDTSRLVCRIEAEGPYPPCVVWRDPTWEERGAILEALKEGAFKPKDGA